MKKFTLSDFKQYSFILRSKAGVRNVSVIAMHKDAAKFACGAVEGEEIIAKGAPRAIGLLQRAIGLRPKGDEVANYFLEMGRAATEKIADRDALKLMVPLASSPYFRGVIGGLWYLTAMGHGGGLKLGDCMGLFPGAFDEVAVNLVKTGESSGKMGEIYEVLAKQARADVSTGRKVMGAMSYPIMIVLMIVAAVILVFTFVLPRMKGFFMGMTGKIPPLTANALLVSDFLSKYWIIIPVLGALFGLFVVRFGDIYAKSKRMQSFIIALPGIGRMVRARILARCFRAYAMLDKAGLPEAKCFEIVRRVAAHHVFQSYFENVQRLRAKGERLHKSFILSQNMIGGDGVKISGRIEIAATTGQVGKVSEDIAKNYEEDVAVLSERLPELIQPILLVLVGCVILMMMMIVFLPYFGTLTEVMKHKS